MSATSNKNVSMRDLRNHGRSVVDRVLSGESLIVTSDGTPVAELRPLARRPLDVGTLLGRWRHVPVANYDDMRRELDEIVDPAL